MGDEIPNVGDEGMSMQDYAQQCDTTEASSVTPKQPLRGFSAHRKWAAPNAPLAMPKVGRALYHSLAYCATSGSPALNSRLKKRRQQINIKSHRNQAIEYLA